MPVSIFTRHSIHMRPMNVYSSTADMKTKNGKASFRAGLRICVIALMLLFTMTSQKAGAQTWNNIGTAGFTSGPALQSTAIAIDGSGTPYVVYKDGANGNKASVMKFNGSNWVNVGTLGFSAGIVDWTRIAIDPTTGSPYVVYSDSALGGKATVMMYNGASWMTVGSAGFTPSAAGTTSIAIDNTGTLYVAFQDIATSFASVMKYNGSSWVSVGTADFSAAGVYYTNIAISSTGAPYVLYQDYSVGGGSATVMTFNGTNWVNVGTPGFSAGAISYPSISIDASGTPYVVYQDNANSNFATAMKFNGVLWVNVGSVGFSTSAVTYPSIVLSSTGVPYVVYQDSGISNKATVMMFNGSTWAVVGTPGISAGGADWTTIALDGSDRPYIAYGDAANSEKVSVMEFSTLTAPSGIYFNGGSPLISVCQNSINNDIGTFLELNDTVAGETDTWALVSGPSEGSAVVAYSVTSTGSVLIPTGLSYTPGAGYVGTDSFTVLATNGTDTVYTNIYVTVVAPASIISDTWENPSTCGGSDGLFEISEANPGDIYTVNYTFNGTPEVTTAGADGSGNIYITGLTSGTYDAITITSSLGCVSNAVGPDILTDPPITVAPISGNSTVCTGSMDTLADATSGGAWSASNFNAAVSSIGVVTGATAGADTIIYTVSSATCGTVTATMVVTVNATPSITSTSSANPITCGGSDGYISVGNFSPGATYTINYTYNGTPETGSNIANIVGQYFLSGLSVGTYDEINITSGSGCTSTNVGPIVLTGTPPTVGSVGGSDNVCVAGTATLAATGTSGGTWSASNSNALIDPSTGIVTGSTQGLDTFTYSVTNLCGTASGTHVVAVEQPASTILGSTTVCGGAHDTLTDATTGGTWSATNSKVAVSTAGVITAGTTAGADTITYTVNNVCGTSTSTLSVTVVLTPTVAAIGGVGNVCPGATITLTESTLGGIWTSTAGTGSATNTLGVVTGVTAGTDTIKYTVTNTCGSAVAKKTVNVRALVYAGTISGPTSVCLGSPVTLIADSTGGTWSASNTDATFTSTGSSATITGSILGIDTIRYRRVNTCNADTATYPVTIMTIPAAGTISGTLATTVGSSTTLTETNTGGTWSSILTSIATVDGSGDVQGISVGTDPILYTVSNSCGARNDTAYVVVTSAGASFANGAQQNMSVCENSGIASVNTQLAVSDAASGDALVWTVSSAPVHGTLVAATSATSTGSIVTPSGLTYTPAAGYSGIDSFTVHISPAGAIASTTVYVSVVAPVIPVLTPTATAICNTGSATINNATFLSDTLLKQNFNGALAPWIVDSRGSVGIYSSGPWQLRPNVYDDELGTIDGPDGGFLLTNADTSGSVSVTQSKFISPQFSTLGYSAALVSFQQYYDYYPSDTSASVDVSTDGGTTWTTLVNYTLGGAVGTPTAFATTTVSLNAYLGQPNVKIRFNYNSPWGNEWAIDNVAVIGSSSGSATWSPVTNLYTDAGFTTPYTPGTYVNTVYADPAAATVNTVTTYYATASNGSCASVDSSVITTNVPAAPLGGPTTVCAGANITLTETTTGGTWTKSNNTANVVGGVVTGVAAGVDTITYTVVNACGTSSVSAVITINATSAGTISGASAVCRTSAIVLTDAASGGVWSASNGNATIVAGTGSVTVTGVTVGVDTISYTVSNTCGTVAVTHTVTVNDVPVVSGITGTMTVCPGANTLLHDVTPLGSWSSSDNSIATVSAGGSVRGIAAGAATITYGVANTCGSTSVTATVTVNPLPNAGSITGTDSVCQGLTSTLVDATGTGSWTSSNNAVASVGAISGIVTGITGGTANIFYSVTNSCGTASVSVSFKVNPSPNAGTISGATNVCNGSTVGLTDGAIGGTWSSTDNTIATVDNSGNVTGIAVGSATISYLVGNVCGTVAATSPITVNLVPNPGTISNNTNICAGGSITLAEDSTGGVWSSGNAAVATIDPVTGMLQGISQGSALISYSITLGSCTGVDTATEVVGAPPIVNPITGPTSVCLGSSIPLTDTLAGGSWSSSNTSIATVDPVSGVVTGVNSGSAIITYAALNTCGGGYNTLAITVKNVSAVSAISGATNLCQGDVTVLSDAVPTGVWTNSNNSLATINSVSGQITTFAAGIDTVTYSVTNASGCVTFATAQVTINAVPVVSAISGLSSVCVGSSISLSDTSSGGVWSSTNSGVASVNSAGQVTGRSAGTATISFTITNAGGCSGAATQLVTVHPEPGIIPISGAASLCAGNNTLLTDATSGGTWSSSNSAVASVTTGGSLTGIMSGTVTVSYSITNAFGCTNQVTEPFTVNPLPVGGSITGPSAVCIGSTITLSDASGGGVWSSSNPVVASIDPVTGTITPLAAPAAVVITYSVTNVCGSASTTANITINPLPVAGTISGANIVCPGAALPLTDTTSGGVWSSSDNSVAGVNPFSGIVTGVGTGTVTITYAVTTSCGTAYATDSLSGNPTPQAITGITTICSGLTTLLSDTTTGGDWVSQDPTIANVNTTTGLVGGINAGSTIISYNAGAGCTNFVTIPVTVNALPSVSTITGPVSLCAGTQISLGDATPAGVWSSSDNTVATVDGSGNVTGIAGGITEIAYTVTNLSGCNNAANKYVTVNAITALSPIAGTTTICQDGETTLTDTTSGGTWSSSDNTIAYIDAVTGDVLAISPGTVTITYSALNPSGCVTEVTTSLTVNAVPVLSATTGTDSVCSGSSVTLSNTTLGGVWTSSDNTIATVDASGDVTGISGGTVDIGYVVTNGSGCSNTASVSFMVKGLPAPGPISGITSLCQGTDVLFSDPVAGGNWISSNDTIASVNSGGVVIGLVPGVATISYSISNSCATVVTTLNVNVIAAPSAGAITGPTNVCVSSAVSLTSGVAGGVWSTSNGNASITTAGMLTGNTAGTDTITYTVTNLAGCFTSVTAIDTINALPVVAAISGPSSVCAGAGIALTSGATGVWTSSNSNASVSATGFVTGNTAGMDTISYTETNAAGCVTSVRAAVTINALPVVAPITDATTVCAGANISLTDDTTGGVWSASNANATITSAGIITGITAGLDTISYSLTNGCGTATTIAFVTVNPLPVVDTIAGGNNVCIGSAITLSDDSTGGVWFISNGNATLAPSGLLTGVTAGMDTITYLVGNTFGCSSSVTSVITVNPLAAVTAITGTSAICAGATWAFGDTTALGTWSSSDATIASVDASGNVTGVAPGAAVIMYGISNICGTATATFAVTVSPVPTVNAITGTAITCSGLSSLLSDTTPDGVWSSSNTAIATVDPLGAVTGITSGDVVITYMVTNAGGCSASATYTMTIGTPIPAAVLLPTVSATLCGGNPVNLLLSPAPSGVSFQWEINGDVISGATNSSYTTDTFGLFTVTMSNGTCSGSLGPVNVILPPHPVIAYNAVGNYLFTGSFATIQWYYNGNLIPGATTSILSSPGAGNYTVVVADGNGCTDTSVVYIVAPSGTSGVNNVNGIDVKVYPNPATSTLQISAPVKVNVLILSLDGKIVIDQKDASVIDITNLADGMYIIKAYDEQSNLLKTDKFAKIQ